MLLTPPYLQGLNPDDSQGLREAVYQGATELGFKIIGGGIADCRIADFSRWPPRLCGVEWVKEKAKALLDSWQGDKPRVLIFHDNRPVTYNNIREIISYLEEQGFTLVHFDPDQIGKEQNTKQAISGAAHSPVDLTRLSEI